MKITDIKIYLIGIAQPELVILEIFTDEGFTGLGECTFAAPGIGIGTGIIGVMNSWYAAADFVRVPLLI